MAAREEYQFRRLRIVTEKQWLYSSYTLQKIAYLEKINARGHKTLIVKHSYKLNALVAIVYKLMYFVHWIRIHDSSPLTRQLRCYILVRINRKNG